MGCCAQEVGYGDGYGGGSGGGQKWLSPKCPQRGLRYLGARLHEAWLPHSVTIFLVKASRIFTSATWYCWY